MTSSLLDQPRKISQVLVSRAKFSGRISVFLIIVSTTSIGSVGVSNQQYGTIGCFQHCLIHSRRTSALTTYSLEQKNLHLHTPFRPAGSSWDECTGYNRNSNVRCLKKMQCLDCKIMGAKTSHASAAISNNDVDFFDFAAFI